MIFWESSIDEYDLKAESEIIRPCWSFPQYLNGNFKGKVSEKTHSFFGQTRNYHTANAFKYKIVKYKNITII